MLRRSATATATTQTLGLHCPQCATRLLRDELGIWCGACLWCGACAGRGCQACPQPDATPSPAVDAAPLRRCETCQRSVRAGQWPQCLECLMYHVPPAEIVPLVGATSAVVRHKRHRWLRLHPGWGLVPAGDWVMRAPGTRDNPFGRQLVGVRYVVERGHTTVV